MPGEIVAGLKKGRVILFKFKARLPINNTERVEHMEYPRVCALLCFLFFSFPWLHCRAAEEVLVMPFADYTQSRGASDRVTGLFARELVRTGNYRVYHPRALRKYLNSRQHTYNDPWTSDEALETAKTFGARYVISGIITEYDGFPPFSLDISVEIFDVESKERVGADSISGAGPRARRWFDPPPRQQTMDQYVAAVCAQLIKRGFKKENIIKPVNKI
jgi:hypothetical protein